MRGTLFIIFCFFCSFTQAQHVIQGQVTDPAGKPIAGVSVWVESRTSMVTFSRSKEDGSFQIKLDVSLDSLVLKAKTMNYAEYKQSISNQSQSVPITLQPQATELREVVITNPSPVRRNGDTLSYSVDKFATKNDRVVADLLKKLPGITVESDGRILYQGDPIQKFYIEGMDLLNGQYNLASNNLPVKAVKDIQVIERHQPIRVLDSLVRSERASLNLKLKNGVAQTGTAKVGGGFNPFLWDVNVTPMLFTQKQQMIVSYQTNNTGKDVALDLKTLTVDDFKDNLTSLTRKQDLVRVQALTNPPFEAHRYLFNQTHLVSFNYLFKVKKYTELRLNASYLNQRTRQNGSTFTRFYTEQDTIQLYENKQNRQYAQTFEGTASIIHNSPRQYLENTFHASLTSEQQSGAIETGTRSINQNLHNPYYSFYNRFKLLKTIGRQVVSLHSSSFYTKTPQRLFVHSKGSDSTDNIINQQVLFNHFHTNNYASFSKKLGIIDLSQTAGFLFESQDFQSDLSYLNPFRSITNDSKLLRYKYYSLTESNFTFNKLTIRIKIPVSLWKLTLTEPYRFIAEPSALIKYTLSQVTDVRVNYSVSNQFPNLSYLYPNRVMKDYRTFQENHIDYIQRKSQIFYSGIFHVNTLKAVFANLTYSFSKTFSNVLPNTTLSSEGDLITIQTFQPNQTQSHSINGHVSKYILSTKTNLSLTSNAQMSLSNQVVNENYSSIRNYVWFNTLRIEQSFGNQLGLTYSLNRIDQKNTINTLNQGRYHSNTHQFNSYYNLFTNHTVSFSGEIYELSYSTTQTSNSFFDLTYRYTFPKSKFELEGQWNNIFNSRSYTFINNDTYSYILNTYQLRPSQFLVTGKFSF